MASATVVICTHERARVVGRAIAGAVAEASACGAEVLVVDNASSDGTPALLAELACRHAPVLRVVGEPQIIDRWSKNLPQPKRDVVHAGEIERVYRSVLAARAR